MVSAIGSYSSSILQYMQSSQFNSQEVSTTAGRSFESLIANGDISIDDNNSSTGVTSMGGMGGSSESSSSSEDSEMDLNHDGTVTLDEIIQYTAMKMMEQAQETNDAAETAQNSQNNDEKENQQQNFDIKVFQQKIATSAYKIGESLISSSVGAVTQNFMI